MPKHHKLSIYEKWGVFCLSVLIIYVTWWKSGRGLPDRWGLLAVSAFTFVALPVGVWWNARKRGETVVLWRNILKDPFFYVSLAFLVYVGIQTWNSPRELVFNREIWEWEYGPPPYPNLPSAINAAESQQMLIWFFSAWVPVIYLRAKLFTFKAAMRLLQIMVVNAGLLAIFGFIQYATGTTKQYWFHSLPGYFFSSFGYPNHAGEFFYFNACLCAGLFFNTARVDHNSRVRISRRCGWYGVFFCLCIVGSILSKSVAAMGMSALIVIGSILYGAKKYMKYFHPSQQVNALILFVWSLFICGFVVVKFGGEDLVGEYTMSFSESRLIDVKNPPPKSFLGRRYTTWGPALRMMPDYLMYGTGSWGFRYLKKMYIPRDEWTTRTGHANVHNDAIQFFVEYGVLGGGLVLISGFTILHGFLRHAWWNSSLALFVMVGFGLILVHSMVDIPFRCPAVLVYFVSVMALPFCSGRLSNVAERGMS